MRFHEKFFGSTMRGYTKDKNKFYSEVDPSVLVDLDSRCPSMICPSLP